MKNLYVEIVKPFGVSFEVSDNFDSNDKEAVLEAALSALQNAYENNSIDLQFDDMESGSKITYMQEIFPKS
jgi:hypothetical protein